MRAAIAAAPRRAAMAAAASASSAYATPPTLTDVVSCVTHSLTRAAMNSICLFFDPSKTLPARTMAESAIPKALAEAIETYGLTWGYHLGLR